MHDHDGSWHRHRHAVRGRAPEHAASALQLSAAGGPSWSPEDTPERRTIQEGHLANIQRLADEGKLILAGPFTDGGELRGLFVFQVGSLEEAKALCDSDPAVKAGRLRVELHPWYSAKGINVPKPPKPAQ